jgi:Domain of unknown function (DUF397)
MGVEPDHHSPTEWRKSRFSADTGNCVEISSMSVSVLVRDSKDTMGPVLTVSRIGWALFLRCIRNS